MAIIDGVDLLNGKVSKGTDLPRVCINKDLEVVAWIPGEGLRPIGRGRDLESAKAIARLHAGRADHYIDFTDGVNMNLLMLESDRLRSRME